MVLQLIPEQLLTMAPHKLLRLEAYNDLVINQSGGQASLGGAVTVNGVLTMTNGILNLNGFDLTLGDSCFNINSRAFSNKNDSCFGWKQSNKNI
jgi:hypothetical protein